jgi:hypothetical protein
MIFAPYTHNNTHEAVRVYGVLWLGHTMFTWYGHKILVYTVLTVAVSDLLYSTLHLQRQCLI